MKILLVGLGSIGRRHLSCLQEIDNLELAALRTSKGTLLELESDVLEFYNPEDAFNYNPDGVIISNPTAFHVGSALPFLRTGCKVLIEKPIAHSCEEAILLNSYKERIRVAYCFRFLPVYKKLEEIIRIENPFKVGFKRSYYLPKWHPYADYRKEYVAKKELGGGVVRTLSHEIDLALHWFGLPVRIDGITDKVSFLEMDTDDYAFFSMKTSSNTRINFELDLFSPVNINEGEMYTSKGRYYWNISSISFQSYIAGEVHNIYQQKSNDIDTMYLEQMTDFISFVKSGDSLNATYDESINILNVIETVDGK